MLDATFSAFQVSTNGAKVENVECMMAMVVIQRKESRTLIDTGATHNFKKHEAQRLDIKFKEEHGF